jgi:hypothetical protein
LAELYYPELLTNKEAFPANIHFTFYERFSTKASEMRDQIHLYMPEQFGQPNTVTWDSSFRGGQAIIGALGGVASTLGSVGKFVSQKIGELQRVAGGPTADLAELKAGMLLNPYLSQVFRGVDFRNFQYTFRFVPYSEGDCENIKEILTIFRKWALPSGPAGGATSIYLNYPGEVEVQYQFLDGENYYIHRFKRSVITSLDIDYTGAGMWTMMRNGFPTETVMNIRLSEIQIVVREDVEGENY